MPPYTFAPVTADDRETISTIFCSSDDSWLRPALPRGNLSKPNSWHYKIRDAAQDNKPIAFARWILPERVFKKLSMELNSKGGVMGVEGESEENMVRYARERQQGYVNGEPLGMDPRVPKESSVDFKIMHAKAPVTYLEYIELEALHTLPEHERKGAGTALIEWGIRLADSEGLHIRLLTTSHGFGLYRKFGFVELAQVTFDLARWSGEGDITYYIMSSEPKAPKS